MTQSIKFRIKVYSDCEVRNPEAYYNSVFQYHHHLWKLIPCDDSNCIRVESRQSYNLKDESELESLYDMLTPEMYESTSRSYHVVK